MKLTELLYPFAFLPVCLVLYYVLPKRCRNAALLAASLLFFAWGTPEYLVLLALAGLLGAFTRFREKPLRALPYLKKDGLMIVNTQQILPMPVITGAAEYPEDALARVRAAADTVALDAVGIAEKCGTFRAANVVLLGVLAKRMQFPAEQWREAIRALVKPQFAQRNLDAFEAGYRCG